MAPQKFPGPDETHAPLPFTSQAGRANGSNLWLVYFSADLIYSHALVRTEVTPSLFLHPPLITSSPPDYYKQGLKARQKVLCRQRCWHCGSTAAWLSSPRLFCWQFCRIRPSRGRTRHTRRNNCPLRRPQHLRVMLLHVANESQEVANAALVVVSPRRRCPPQQPVH